MIQKKKIDTTVKIVVEQTFDFLRRQLLHATDVRAALGISEISSGK